MNNPSDISIEDLQTIDSYLAGELAPGEALEFEHRLAAEAELASAVAQQRLIAESLSRAFQTPSDAVAAEQLRIALNSSVEPSADEGGRRSPWRIGRAGRRWVPAAAAAIVIGAGLALWLGGALGNSRAQPKSPFAMVTAANFQPSLRESDVALLEAMVVEKLGAAITLPRGQGIRYLGLQTGVGGSPLSVGIVLDVGSRREMLVLDRSGATPEDRSIVTAALGDGVFTHRRVVGSFSVIEWTDSPTPVLSWPTGK